MIVGHATDAFFESFTAEIDEQAERKLKQEIGSKAFRQFHAVITDRDWRLSLNIQAPTRELIKHDRLINGFEQPRPQILVQVKSAIDGYACQFLDIQPAPFFAPLRLCVSFI